MTRNISVDLLKIVMALFVVGVHVNPLELLGPDATVFLGGGLFRVAVPVFFVINGYFFEPVARSGGTRRYVLRLLGLYAIWTLIYLPAWRGVIDNSEPWPLLRILVMGWWQLWYLPALALAAMLAAAVRDWPLHIVLGLMAVCFLAGVGITYAIAFDLIHPSRSYFGDATVLHRNGLFTGFPFVMAGVLIRRHRLDQRLNLRLLTGLAAAALLLVLLESASLHLLAPRGVNHDNLLALALACPLLVLLVLNVPRQGRTQTLGTYANGLFFVHVAFVVIGFRHSGLPDAGIYLLAVLGSLAVTWGLIRSGLARHLL